MSMDTYPLPSVAPFALPHLADTAAARTIARRLDRLGMADTDNASTQAWVNDLQLYEALMEKEARVALYVGQTRRVDTETGEVTHGHPDDLAEAAWRAFATDLALWREHAEEAGRILTMLDGALDHMALLTIDEPSRWTRVCGLWIGMRHGPLKRPLPPGAPWNGWVWQGSYRDWLHQGWRHATVCRQRYRALTKESKRAAIAEFGLEERGQVDPLWHGIWPIAQQDALDRRAQELHVCDWWGLIGPGSRRKVA